MNRLERRDPTEPTIYDACRTGDISRVTSYVEKGGCVTESDEQKMTFLHHAAFSGNVDVIRIVLKAQETQRVDLDAVDGDGWTPLHYASDRGHSAVVSVLLDEGANASSKDGMKRTPLHLAAARGHVECVKALLAGGAARSAKTVVGWDALRYATENNHQAVADLLAPPV